MRAVGDARVVEVAAAIAARRSSPNRRRRTLSCTHSSRSSGSVPSACTFVAGSRKTSYTMSGTSGCTSLRTGRCSSVAEVAFGVADHRRRSGTRCRGCRRAPGTGCSSGRRGALREQVAELATMFTVCVIADDVDEDLDVVVRQHDHAGAGRNQRRRCRRCAKFAWLLFTIQLRRRACRGSPVVRGRRRRGSRRRQTGVVEDQDAAGVVVDVVQVDVGVAASSRSRCRRR